MRAYLEHGLAREPQPVKLWYVAPMFRYARAQRGRYREHWQFGVESLGSDDPAVDAEVIALQAAWFGELGLLDGLELRAQLDRRPRLPSGLSRLLVAYLERFRSELSEDSGAPRRQSAAHLRLQGRGRSEDRGRRPAHHRPLCADCAEHFAGVRAFLDARGVAYLVTPELVRGLDYYERTAWEWVIPGGGSQAGIDLGRRPLRRSGRADRRRAGARRRLRLRHRARRARTRGGRRRARRRRVWTGSAPARTTSARPAVHALIEQARARGLACQADLAGRSLKGQLRHGERLGARVVTVCRAGDGARGIVRHGGAEIAFGDVVDYVERSVRNA